MKRSRFRRLFLLVTVLALVAAACGDDSGDAAEDTIEELESEVADLEGQVAELEAANDALVSGAADLADSVGGMANLIGSDAESARDGLLARGLAVTTVDESNIDVASGTVVGQLPEPGIPIVQGSSVVLYVAADVPWTSVQVFRGSEPRQTTPVLLDGAEARINFAFTGEGENTITLEDPDGGIIEQLVGVVGPRAASVPVDYSGEYVFTIGMENASNWSLEVQKR